MIEPAESLQNLLLAELRAAVSARIENGAGHAEVLADLDQRLQRLRDLLSDTIESGPPRPGQPDRH